MSQKSVQETFRDIAGLTATKVLPAVNTLLNDLGGKQYTLTEINYIYGHGVEVANAMKAIANDPTEQVKQFPLIWLEEDIRFTYDGAFDVVTIPRIIIAWCSDQNYESQQREVQSFVPVLRPIYNELIRQIAKHPRFWVYDDRAIKKGIERKFWGTEENTKGTFSDYVDAIEINNIELKLTPDNCS